MNDDIPTPTPDDPTADLGGFVPVSGDADGISWAEFVALGYLQELNRRFLHPLGLALEVEVKAGVPVGVGIRDDRDDLEGIVFAEPRLAVHRARRARAALFVERAWQARAEARVRARGWMVQPVPEVSAAAFDRWFAELGGSSIDVAGNEEARTDG